MIELKNVEKIFQSEAGPLTALQNINLSVNQGEIFGIIGRSGAGKSTLIRCVNGLEQPSAGQVLVDGQDLTGLSAKGLREARHRMGMIFQHFNLLSSKTVYENIAFPLKLVKKPKEEIKERVGRLLELTGMSDRKDYYPSQLSGGQKQRVAIARALSLNPQILLCDEATSALDPSSTKSIFELLRTINKELGLTILLITHEMDVIKNLCDKVAVIEHGEIIEQNQVAALFARPQAQVTKELIDASSHLELPMYLKEQLLPTPGKDTGMLLKVAYFGDSASEPIMSYLMQNYSVVINILQGNIDIIQDQTIGTLIIEMRGEQSDLNKSITFLERNDLTVEILGYVNRNH